jgi:hypothetical protein
MTPERPAMHAPRDWFYWVVASYTGLQVLWAAAVAVDFLLNPWAPDLGQNPPLQRLLTVVIVVPLTAGIALLVLRRTSGNVVGLCLLLWSTSIMGSSLRPASALVPYNAFNTGWIGLWLLPQFFPDGRPRPRRLASLIRGLSALLVAGQPIGLLFYPDQSSGGRADLANGLYVPALGGLQPIVAGLFGLLLGATLLLIVPSLVARYRSSDAHTRQQMKWLAWLFGLLLLIIPVVHQFGLLSNTPVKLNPPLQLADNLLGIVIVVGPSLVVGQAILRHRLYDIDVIIRRTLIYAALTGLLALAYFGSIVVLQNIFSALTGQSQSTLVTVLSTLVIAALFGPLRARVQAVIDRRLYRRKYDAARTLAAFGTSVRDEVELAALTEHLLGVVDATMQPQTVGLWLRAPERRQP